jgi:hypothetical protein
VDGQVILKKDIPGYFTEFFWSAVKVWKMFRKFGPPNGSGYMNEPADNVKIYEMFEAIHEQHEAAAMQKSSARASPKTPHKKGVAPWQ